MTPGQKAKAALDAYRNQEKTATNTEFGSYFESEEERLAAEWASLEKETTSDEQLDKLHNQLRSVLLEKDKISDQLKSSLEVSEKLRLQLADTLNETEKLRQRLQREKDTQVKYAITSFAKEMLEIADGLHSAIDHTGEEHTFDGLSFLENLLLKTFEKFGIRKVPCEIANPEFHQVISGNTKEIIEVVREGYTINDRLLREATVVTKSE